MLVLVIFVLFLFGLPEQLAALSIMLPYRPIPSRPVRNLTPPHRTDYHRWRLSNHGLGQVWDLGGQTSIRPYWRCYYPNTDAIVFVVDSSDRERMSIAKQELMAMLEVRGWVGGVGGSGGGWVAEWGGGVGR